MRPTGGTSIRRLVAVGTLGALAATAIVVGSVATAPAGAGNVQVTENCSKQGDLTTTGDAALGAALASAVGSDPFDLVWPATSTLTAGVRPTGVVHLRLVFGFDADALAGVLLTDVVKPAVLASGRPDAGAEVSSAALNLDLSGLTATVPLPPGLTFDIPTVKVTPGGPAAQADAENGDLVLVLGDLIGNASQASSVTTTVPESTSPFAVTVDVDASTSSAAIGSTIPVKMGGLTFGFGPADPGLAGFHVSVGGANPASAGVTGAFTCTNGTQKLGQTLVTKVAPFGSRAAFVNRQYRDFVGRPPTQAETSAAVDRLAGPTTAAQFILDLRRNTNAVHSDALTVVDPVTRLYFAYLGRTPDAGGLAYWIGRKRAGKTLSSISSTFAASNEFKTKYGNLTNRAFVQRIYTDVLGRAADPGGLDYWTKKLDTHKATRGAVMIGFSESSEYKRKKADDVDVAVTTISMLQRTPTAAEVEAGLALLAGTPDVDALADFELTSALYRARIDAL